jgi:integrase/recombinase XerD
MTALETTTTTVTTFTDRLCFDEAEVAAVAFLSRYSGRTLDAYRHDLRMFFQWAGDHDLAVLDARRPHIELYRASMEDRGRPARSAGANLAASRG